MSAIDFNPRHDQPFTLEQAMMLEIDMLVTEISRLTNSIEHLKSTQEELRNFMDEEPEGDEDGEIEKAMRENEEVIASQTERITLIKVALLNKVGEGAAKHYGFDIPRSTDPPLASTDDPPARASQENQEDSHPANRRDGEAAPDAGLDDDNDQGGMYL